MADVLTQNEIDELLSALAAGRDTPQEAPPEQEEKEAKPYNFRTANKFPKEQIRMLNFIYDNYANRLSTYLSGTLRALCEVEVVSIEEQTFSEFNNSLPTPVFLAILNIHPLAGSSILEISSSIAYEIISRVFGGTGQFSDNNKVFTEIEVSILTRIIQQMMALMGEAWEKVAKVTATVDRIETSSQFAQIVPSNEPIAIITINVKIGEVSDLINMCIPHVALQPVAKQLAMKSWYNEGNSQTIDSASKEKINSRISSTQLTLHAVFNETDATIRDVVSLQVGDVIRVDHNIDEHITVMVEHMPKFKGFIGLQGQRIAVKISDIIKEEMEHE